MRKCISSFATADGKVIAAGEFVEDGDPVIKGHEVFFAGVSDPIKAPELGDTDKEGGTVAKKPDKPEKNRAPDLNGVNPPHPDNVDVDPDADAPGNVPLDERETDTDEDDNRGFKTADASGTQPAKSTEPADTRSPAKPAARTFVVEEATADPGSKRDTGRK